MVARALALLAAVMRLLAEIALSRPAARRLLWEPLRGRPGDTDFARRVTGDLVVRLRRRVTFFGCASPSSTSGRNGGTSSGLPG